MVLDVLTALPIIITLTMERPRLLAVSLLLACITIGAFSVLPAGIEEAALLAAVAAGAYLKTILNTRSFISLVLLVVIMESIYVILFLFSWHIANDGVLGELVRRGGAFFMRELIIMTSLAFFCMFFAYSIRIMRYAFVEEKVL